MWLDQWEIRVGDSIVEKINDALTSASHLAVLLSTVSVTRPWVTKEFSAALMLQLADRAIRVLPIRLDGCTVPAILADLRYADCRSDTIRGFQEVFEAILDARETSSRQPESA